MTKLQMKNTIKNLLILASSATLLGGCASTSDLEDLRYQLRIVNKKIEDMKSTTVGQLQKRQAAASGHMDQLEQDILELKAQLDESYHLNSRLREQNKELEESISMVAEQEAAKREEVILKLEEQQRLKEMQLVELNNKLLAQEESVKAIKEARIKEAERRAREAALEAELAKKRSKAAAKSVSFSNSSKSIRATKKKVKKSVVAPPLPKTNRIVSTVSPAPVVANKPSVDNNVATTSPAKKVPTAAPVSEYDKGLNLYGRKKYTEAYQIFEQVVNAPSTGKSVDARFMMGECLYQQKEYDKAIMQYQKIISQYSTHQQAPEAMLKQAMAFEKLADKGTAKVIYKKLAKKHPDSKQGIAAKKKLESP